MKSRSVDAFCEPSQTRVAPPPTTRLPAPTAPLPREDGEPPMPSDPTMSVPAVSVVMPVYVLAVPVKTQVPSPFLVRPYTPIAKVPASVLEPVLTPSKVSEPPLKDAALTMLSVPEVAKKVPPAVVIKKVRFRLVEPAPKYSKVVPARERVPALPKEPSAAKPRTPALTRRLPLKVLLVPPRMRRPAPNLVREPVTDPPVTVSRKLTSMPVATVRARVPGRVMRLPRVPGSKVRLVPAKPREAAEMVRLLPRMRDEVRPLRVVELPVIVRVPEPSGPARRAPVWVELAPINRVPAARVAPPEKVLLRPLKVTELLSVPKERRPPPLMSPA